KPPHQVAAQSGHRRGHLTGEEFMTFSGRSLMVATRVILAVAACGGTASPSSGASAAPADVKIMVGGLNKQIYLPNMLTQQLGYFREQNLNVTLVDEASGQGSEDAVIAGNVDA